MTETERPAQEPKERPDSGSAQMSSGQMGASADRRHGGHVVAKTLCALRSSCSSKATCRSSGVKHCSGAAPPPRSPNRGRQGNTSRISRKPADVKAPTIDAAKDESCIHTGVCAWERREKSLDTKTFDLQWQQNQTCYRKHVQAQKYVRTYTS